MTSKNEENKVTVVSQTKRVSNESDSSRKFNIAMDVQMSDGKITLFNNGSVFPLETVNGGNGSFSLSDDNFTFNSWGFTKQQNRDAMNAVFTFIDDAQSSLTE